MALQRKLLDGIQINNHLVECWKEALVLARANPNWSDDSKDSIQTTTSPKDMDQAIRFLKATQGLCSDAKSMPLSVLKSIQIVYRAREKDATTHLAKLEAALQKSSLRFSQAVTRSSTKSEKEQLLFQRRMEQLRLQNEETNYSKLTNNLQDHRQDDDITAKSMTFAASVGLNMIIAPLSFGCFMYFFAGGLLDYFFASDEFEAKPKPGGTDIKRVIVGVVSGVVMMIIEMLLFVIRTHEFEEHARKKKQKKGVEPFGVYSKNTVKTYTDKNPGVSKLVQEDSDKKSK